MIYTEFHAQIHEDRDDRKRILFAFIILQKHNVLLLLLWVHTNKRRVFTDLKDVLLLSVWPEMEYFKSKWAPAPPSVSFTLHTDTSIAHISLG